MEATSNFHNVINFLTRKTHEMLKFPIQILRIRLWRQRISKQSAFCDYRLPERPSKGALKYRRLLSKVSIDTQAVFLSPETVEPNMPGIIAALS